MFNRGEMDRRSFLDGLRAEQFYGFRLVKSATQNSPKTRFIGP